MAKSKKEMFQLSNWRMGEDRKRMAKKYSEASATKWMDEKEKELQSAIKHTEVYVKKYKANPDKDQDYQFIGCEVKRFADHYMKLLSPAEVGWAAQKVSADKVVVVEYRRTQSNDLICFFVISKPITLTEFKSWLSEQKGKVGKSGLWKNSRILESRSTSLVIKPHLYEGWEFLEV